jgi:hypothetical protein
MREVMQSILIEARRNVKLMTLFEKGEKRENLKGKNRQWKEQRESCRNNTVVLEP